MKFYIDRLWTDRHGLFFLPVFVILVLFNTGSLMRYAGQFVIVVFHEFSHALVSWLFGCPAIPTFNVDGGLTIQMHRSLIVTIILFAFLAFILVRSYSLKSRLFIPLLIISIVYTAIFSQIELCRGLVAFMGHGGEVLWAFIFCYLGFHAFSGRTRPEKFVYVTIGLHFALNTLIFARSLLVDSIELRRYANPGSGVMNDFIVLSEMSGKSVGFFAVLLLVLLFISVFGLLFLLTKRGHMMASYKAKSDDEDGI